ncbi:MAG: Sapep family Mn(2+)-dependent dipeptidase [Erysipelotrichaceae bacterium]|nr:Sapep family Mn(2+)-dependent dipeptidase [Erysipelotrichaceae bacterium]
MDIKKIVKSYEEDILTHISELVSYPSTLDKSDAKYPFGKANADCLDAALKMCEQYGFRTKNLDHYCGYAEIGSGEQLLGVVGHLDVVPVAEGWNTNPFTATKVGNRIYGRGTSDDKGPVACAMTALKIVQDLRPDMNKRIRLIMGCNEESGSECLRYYVEKEGHLDMGFTPDGAFPGVHGEKGMVQASFSCPTTHIHQIEAGIASNVVPNKVTIVLDADCYDKEKLEQYLKSHQLDYQLLEEQQTTLIVYGTSAHASTPQLGVNAVSYALCALHEANVTDEFVQFYVNTFGTTTDGSLLQIAQKDQYGALTLNIGIVKEENHQVSGTIDIRFPVTAHAQPIVDTMSKHEHLHIHGFVEPLFFPEDSPLVSLLWEAYKEVTHDEKHHPETMGGGTYAKGINNCIAFGAEFPGHTDVHIHDANEFIEIEDLLTQTEIYVVALLKLLDA